MKKKNIPFILIVMILSIALAGCTKETTINQQPEFIQPSTNSISNIAIETVEEPEPKPEPIENKTNETEEPYVEPVVLEEVWDRTRAEQLAIENVPGIVVSSEAVMENHLFLFKVRIDVEDSRDDTEVVIDSETGIILSIHEYDDSDDE